MSELTITKTELEKQTNDGENQTTAMDRILNRALENDVDLNRLERLLELRDKEIERQERQNFVRDLCAAQKEYKTIHKNETNTHTKSKYATLDKYIDAIKEPLEKHHFVLFSRIKEQNSSGITVEMTLRHTTGNEISTQGTFPIDGQGSKNSTQSVGSTITYARRYLLGMLLNVASKEDDNDGNKPIEKDCPQHINELKNLIEQTGAEEARILKYAQVESLEDIPDEKAQIVIRILQERLNPKAEQSHPQQEQIYASIQDAEYIHIQDIEYAPTSHE
ncbi:ERF family protein, partial [Bartonella elizabethae]